MTDREKAIQFITAQITRIRIGAIDHAIAACEALIERIRFDERQKMQAVDLCTKCKKPVRRIAPFCMACPRPEER